MSEKNTANTNEPLKSHFLLLLIFYTILKLITKLTYINQKKI